MATNDPKTTFGMKSMRARVLLLVLICAIPTIVSSFLAITALGSVHQSLSNLDRRSVQPLSDLGDLRDMEGDTRVEVWQYLAAAPGDRASQRKDIADTDKQADDDVAAYLTDHGSTTDPTGRLMADFVTKFAAWRTIRNDQVLAAVDAGRAAQATSVANGALNDANETMAEPLDNLFTTEVKLAGARRAAADSEYSSARLEVLIVIAIGLVLSLGTAWFLTRGMLRVVGRIGGVLAAPGSEARVNDDDGSELGALGKALDTMLDEAAAHDAALKREQLAREDQMKANYVRQRLAEQEVRRRAQNVVDETATAVAAELEGVAAEAQAVRDAAATIEARVEGADAATRSVIEQAATTDQVVSAVNDSLHKVAGIAKMIAGVAAQTNLLALNATIEAARAGDAGKGFSVVAQEVKELAASTEKSTTEITATLATLEADAAVMANTIRSMSAGVGGIGEATVELTAVATEQQVTAARLDKCVSGAIERIHVMSTATERLDRRGTPRAAISGNANLRVAGVGHQAGVLDVSAGGARVLVEHTAPGAVDGTVDLELAVGTSTLTLRSRITRREAVTDGDSLGLQFLNLSDRDKADLQQYVTGLLTAEDEAAAQLAN